MQTKNLVSRITKMWNRRIALFFIIAALAGLLICTGLLIQAYVTQNSAFELMRYSFVAFSFAGFLSLMITFYMSTFVSRQRKLLGYASAWIGTVLMLLSFRISFVIQKPELEGWEYYLRVTFTTGIITWVFSRLVGTERGRLRVILEFITCLLMFAAFLLFSLQVRN